MSLESLVLSNLTLREEYSRKVIPFLKQEYFEQRSSQIVFDLVCSYFDKYNQLPTKEALCIDLEALETLTEDGFKESYGAIDNLEIQEQDSLDWLVDQTEKWCQDRAIYLAVSESIQILDGKTKKTKGAIPEILSEALGVSFDTAIGHDYFEDAESRYDKYHETVSRIPFDLEYFNKITKGGLVPKTLTVFMSNNTGGFKSGTMCHMAAANLSQGYNVLYISMEMSEDKISERIDANLLNTCIDDLSLLPKEVFMKKVNRVREKTKGKLKVKEYPTATAGAAHFRHLLNELRLKENFVPDIIYIDYLNICCSCRIKMGGSVNSYQYVKSIAEEIRGLAVEFNLPIVSATQGNRGAMSSSDVDMSDTSESIGLTYTVDLYIAIVTTEELDEMGQILYKQLKNRYADINFYRKFVVGVEKAKMKLFDAEESAQEGIADIGKTKKDSKNGNGDKPVFGNSDFGERQTEDDSMKFVTKKAGRKDFSQLVLS